MSEQWQERPLTDDSPLEVDDSEDVWHRGESAFLP